MRHFLAVPKTSFYGAVTAAACTWAFRWQEQSRYYGRGGRSGRGGGGYHSDGGGGSSNRPPPTGSPDAVPQRIMNKAQDSELSFGTRVAMRDDSIILTEIFKHVPPQGAISIKSLFSALNEDVQQALCEKHGGLRSFLEHRKQIFTVRPHPVDGVLYVVGNPLVAQQYATRDLQLRTMRQMMGLVEEENTQGQRQRRPGGNGGGGGGGGRGGGIYDRNYRRDNSGSDRGEGRNQRRYQGNSRNFGNSNDQYGGGDRRRPSQSRDDRRPHGGGNRSGNPNNSGAPRGRGNGPMGSRAQSFGTRN